MEVWTAPRGAPAAALPLALADLHAALPVGAAVELHGLPDAADDLVAGAGFSIGRPGDPVLATRERTLPDVVGPGMRLLVCGLNPSLYAADAGVGYARPGNRFWPAALAAGIVSVDRDPRHALTHHGVGFTDLVKRASPGAAELSAAELRDGLGRVERLCRLVEPAAVALCGLTGWRTATLDRRAGTGWQERRLGGAPVYVLPNPSGRNAHVTLTGFAEHLARALRP